MSVRAILRHIRVVDAPAAYDTVQMKVFYPAVDALDEQAKLSGIIPPQTDDAPYPVMIFWVGVNCEAYMVYWLAQALAAEKIIVAVVSWLGMNLEGRISITPGIDLGALRRGAYGQALVSSSLPPVLAALRTLDQETLFQGCLDLNRLILAGHSAGGAMALMNAHRHLLPGVVAAISYFTNPLATTALAGAAFGQGELPRLADDVPLLMIGGTHDGVSRHHNQLYGRPDCTSAEITLAMLREGVQGDRGDRYAVVIEGASHYSIADPLDTTIGRTFLDDEPTLDGATGRALLVEVTRRFLDEHVFRKSELSLREWLANAPHIAAFEQR